MKPRATHRFAFLLAAIALLAGGCSLPLPQAQTDPTKTFILSVPASEPTAPTPANAPALRLRPIDVASYLRTRTLIVRRGENEIDFREYARWGEPLEQGIARVLREGLLERGAASSVQVVGSRADDTEAKFEVMIRVLACEGDANGSVAFRAIWEISTIGDNSGNSVVARGDFRPTDLHWTPRNEATLAAALSRAVSGLAGELAAHLPAK